MELDDKICYCFHISKRKVLNYIRVCRPRVPSQISECGGAGTGCGWCVPFLKKFFSEGAQGLLEAAEPLSTREYARQRAAYLRAGHGIAPPGAVPFPTEDERDGESVESPSAN